jgi:hypothetical protein
VNEIDWLAGADPLPLLAHLEGKATPRKLRLFACACVRRPQGWPRLRYAYPRQAVEAAERYAEGQAGDADLQQAREHAEQALAMGAPEFDAYAYAAAAAGAAEDPLEAARNACENMRLQAVREAAYEVPPGHDEARANAEASAIERRAQAELLRELFGNPFRPAHVEPSWATWGNGAAVALARVIYDNNQFEDLPYLADALLDAGCADERMLEHCRTPGGHVRGCWVVDLILSTDR